MDICVDFDGTCTTHEFPKIGKDIGAISVLKDLVACGHNLILFTMRADSEGKMYLTEAVEWFKLADIPLHGIQSNPTQAQWTTSPKAYGHLYIDDAALGCPLTYPPSYEVPYSRDGVELMRVVTPRPFVDWNEVRRLLTNQGLLR